MSNVNETLVPSGRKQSATPVWPPEHAVLAHLLDAHPRRYEPVALAAALRAKLERSQVERAIANLAEAGLVEQTGDSVAPAPKVLRFEALLG